MGRVALSDGWQVRAFDWPQPAEVSRFHPVSGGRGDFIEKYLETLAHWHRQGWHVSAFDWRGQGGSGRLSQNAQVGHANDFAPWIDDLAKIFTQWKAKTKGPHVIVSHSMGGHLLLRTLAERKINPDAAIAIAPMMGFAASPLPQKLAEKMARQLAKWRGPDSPWPSNERPSPPWASRQLLLTHDDARYSDEVLWRSRIAHLRSARQVGLG